MDNISEKILAILNDNVGEDVDWAAETAIIDDEKIDSLDLVAVIGDISDEFDIEIGVDDMVPENFNSLAQMAAMVARLSEEQA